MTKKKVEVKDEFSKINQIPAQNYVTKQDLENVMQSVKESFTEEKKAIRKSFSDFKRETSKKVEDCVYEVAQLETFNSKVNAKFEESFSKVLGQPFYKKISNYIYLFLTILLFLFKVTGLINISWFWVFFPLIFVGIVTFTIGIVFSTVSLLLRKAKVTIGNTSFEV